MSNASLRPGAALGAYPERLEPRPGWLDRKAARLADLAHWRDWRTERLRSFAERVRVRSRELQDRDAAALELEVADLRRDLVQGDFADAVVLRTFALVREMSRRTLGLEHFDVQIMAGYALLHGMLAELETGEGKTLAATLPVCTAALAGIPVHVISVNDYLVERDAELLRPLYEALGLSVGTVLESCPEPGSRRAAYACAVTYVNNKHVAFDYLRDRLLRRARPELAAGGAPHEPGLLMRGLCWAVIDEADSVLVDEARTPLILSRRTVNTDLEATCRVALSLCDRLKEGEDFELDARSGQIELTELGEEQVELATAAIGGVWAGTRRREELARQALSARFLYRRDEHYVVREGRVEIIDPHTGRRMPDRSWEGGLHQMVEVKEGCEVTGQNETLARISYQQFYQRYLRVSGMTGTAREVAGELRDVYGLRTLSIAPRCGVTRRGWPERTFATADEKWSAVRDRVVELHREGRPVLIGTGSVAASDHLSVILCTAGLAHAVLNASQDAQEAVIIERAGIRGQITVATNMAGRGSDIRLGPGCEELGGLHVIATERGEARRVDRQLFGRCGRQGNPGSYELVTSLEDEQVRHRLPAPVCRWLERALVSRLPLAAPLARLAVRRSQRAIEAHNAHLRRELLKLEERLEHALAFAGPAA